MRALVFDEAEMALSLVEDHPRPQPKDGEALIAVLLAGICSTVGQCTPYSVLVAAYHPFELTEHGNGLHGMLMPMACSTYPSRPINFEPSGH